MCLYIRKRSLTHASALRSYVCTNNSHLLSHFDSFLVKCCRSNSTVGHVNDNYAGLGLVSTAMGDHLC